MYTISGILFKTQLVMANIVHVNHVSEIIYVLQTSLVQCWDLFFRYSVILGSSKTCLEIIQLYYCHIHHFYLNLIQNRLNLLSLILRQCPIIFYFSFSLNLAIHSLIILN